MTMYLEIYTHSQQAAMALTELRRKRQKTVLRKTVLTKTVSHHINLQVCSQKNCNNCCEIISIKVKKLHHL